MVVNKCLRSNGILLAELLVILAFCLHLAAQQIAQPTQDSSKPVVQRGWLEGWRVAIVSFGVLDRDQLQGEYYKVIGSGIVFMTGPRTAYIVTAKHVFYDPTKGWHPSEIRIRFGWQDQKSVYAEHGVSIQLRGDAGRDLWASLPDDSDIAAIPAPAPMIENQPSTAVDSIATADDLFEGENIVAIGYPGIVGNEYLVRAISRGGIVAWLNPRNPMENRFLIDSNIYPGNSGGPVIKVPGGLAKDGSMTFGGRAVLLGIVVEAPGQSADFDLKVPGQSQPMRIHEQVPLGGTGVVEPASKVRALLESLQTK
jgi:hypothetical protein